MREWGQSLWWVGAGLPGLWAERFCTVIRRGVPHEGRCSKRCETNVRQLLTQTASLLPHYLQPFSCGNQCCICISIFCLYK